MKVLHKDDYGIVFGYDDEFETDNEMWLYGCEGWSITNGQFVPTISHGGKTRLTADEAKTIYFGGQ